MDFTLYWFMLPAALLVSTVAMISGIAGTALFIPIFFLGFPLLGTKYVIESPPQMVTAALLTSSFGFASGFIGYYRKKLIDYRLAKRFLKWSILAAMVGAVICTYCNLTFLKVVYASMTIALAYFILSPKYNKHSIEAMKADIDTRKEVIGYNDINKYPVNPIITSIGGLLTGLLSVGIGESTIAQLSKFDKLSFGIGAGTSVFVVMITLLVSSSVQVIRLIHFGGITEVPWHLVVYTIPGVIVGGQLGPKLQGIVSNQTMRKSIAYLFILIGFMMLCTVII